MFSRKYNFHRIVGNHLVCDFNAVIDYFFSGIELVGDNQPAICINPPLGNMRKGFLLLFSTGCTKQGKYDKNVLFHRNMKKASCFKGSLLF